jgi:hypothetical protein
VPRDESRLPWQPDASNTSAYSGNPSEATHCPTSSGVHICQRVMSGEMKETTSCGSMESRWWDPFMACDSIFESRVRQEGRRGCGWGGVVGVRLAQQSGCD